MAKWISVEERLPENVEPCMIKTANGRDIGYCGYNWSNSARKFKYLDGTDIEPVIGKVTHWSPIICPED
jgi:hypothetical protein